ncbi:MAG: hypothetical protein WED05_09580 [Candidatus Atabeyarchaeum deiterrae]
MRRQEHRHLNRRTALLAMYNAFKWLADNGSENHKVGWLGGFPLLTAVSPRDALLALQFLCIPSKRSNNRMTAVEPSNNPTLVGDCETINQLADKARFISFTYSDATCCFQDHKNLPALRQQKETIEKLFTSEHDSDSILIYRSDNLHSNGCNSIRESITNLIAAEFFMSKGFMVLEDTGSGPDLIAFKTKLLEELRERRYIGKGASLSQLATIKAFGKVSSNYKEEVTSDEIIAVESESVSPQSGIKQLREGYGSERFSYMGFFDRRVLAVPFFDLRPKGLDVLTYHADCLQYRKFDAGSVTTDFWRSKKQLS